MRRLPWLVERDGRQYLWNVDIQRAPSSIRSARFDIERAAPARVTLQLRLAVNDGHIAPEHFFDHYDELMTRVRGLRWVTHFLEAHPHATVAIEFSDEQPFDGSFALTLDEGWPLRHDRWVVHRDGRSVFDNVAGVIERGAQLGDVMTPDGQLVAGPFHPR
jgi:hypothetical protein